MDEKVEIPDDVDQVVNYIFGQVQSYPKDWNGTNVIKERIEALIQSALIEELEKLYSTIGQTGDYIAEIEALPHELKARIKELTNTKEKS